MALYNTYRPQEFSQIIGNKETIQSIENLLSKENPPHVYMLSGETGCGKTTIARIMAKHLDCNGMDFYEVNTSNNRGIDTVREITKQSSYLPLEGKGKLYMIDECHKLTNDAQNAFLKLLEDTPPHVYFIFATTEPEKMISALRNRCSEFTVNTLSDVEMYKLLKRIVKREETTLEKEIYEQIILDATGHPRNAIQVLEQVLSVAPENQLSIAKRKSAELNIQVALCKVLMDKKVRWKSVAEILKDLKTQDPEKIRRGVLGYASAVLLSGVDNERLGLILQEFSEPTYNSGFSQIVYAAYSVVKN